jgi:hypothetical protein
MVRSGAGRCGPGPSLVRGIDAEFCGYENGAVRQIRRGAYRVALAVVHRNHTPGDDRNSNLMVACQGCHLRYNWLHHRETRGATTDSKRPLCEHALHIV